MKFPLVSIIIPTLDNYDYVCNCVKSILISTPNIYEIILVNNGHPESLDWIEENERVRKLQPNKNLGWMAAINLATKQAKGEFIMMLNDDTQILDADVRWLPRLMQPMKYPEVGAVAPISNIVMGTQNMFHCLGKFPKEYSTTLLIGLCILVKKSAFEEIGGLDESLGGGDDFDFSIRMRDAGYGLVVRRDVFVYHHGFKTGGKVFGMESWVGEDKTDRTNIEIIKKHGLRKWHECLSMAKVGLPKYQSEDTEGNIIRAALPKKGRIFEVACGVKKTVPEAIGVDIIKGGDILLWHNRMYGSVPTENKSVADIQADVFADNFAEPKSVDVIIARHILEHALDPVQAVQHWAKTLKDGGKLILATPDEEQGETMVMNPDHKHGFTKEGMKNLVECAVPAMKTDFVKDGGNELSIVGVFTKNGNKK